MTISDFKQVAKSRGGFYDNSHKAGENWARTWGLTWWRDVWFYKEFRLNNLVYRTGKVCMRHSSHSRTECIIDDREVTDKDFRRAIADIPVPALTPVVHRLGGGMSAIASRPAPVQLCFEFPS